jgi:hypothetical protein
MDGRTDGHFLHIVSSFYLLRENKAYVVTFILFNLVFPLLISVEYRFEFEEMCVSGARQGHEVSEHRKSFYR